MQLGFIICLERSLTHILILSTLIDTMKSSQYFSQTYFFRLGLLFQRSHRTTYLFRDLKTSFSLLPLTKGVPGSLTWSDISILKKLKLNFQAKKKIFKHFSKIINAKWTYSKIIENHDIPHLRCKTPPPPFPTPQPIGMHSQLPFLSQVFLGMEVAK